jgi:hypothetical protein
MAEKQIEELTKELRTLKIRVATLEAENDQRVRRESHEYTRTLATPNEKDQVNGIGIGDRVRITNHVKKPAYWTKAWDGRRKNVWPQSPK